jgi:hypothetical protein
MTMRDVVDAVVRLDGERREHWLLDLGWAMTVSARAGYPLAKQAEPIPHLMAFNEMQHQLFNYLRHSRTEGDWTIENLVQGLFQKVDFVNLIWPLSMVSFGPTPTLVIR